MPVDSYISSSSPKLVLLYSLPTHRSAGYPHPTQDCYTDRQKRLAGGFLDRSDPDQFRGEHLVTPVVQVHMVEWVQRVRGDQGQLGLPAQHRGVEIQRSGLSLVSL